MTQSSNPTDKAEVDRLLELVQNGDDAAREQLIERLYHILKPAARQYFAQGHEKNAKQASDILKMTLMQAHLLDPADQPGDKQDKKKSHLLGYAALTMQRILSRQARKKGSPRPSEVPAPEKEKSSSGLEDALKSLRKSSPRAARIVELRYYSGMSVEQAATFLGVEKAAIQHDWTEAKEFLAKVLRTL